MAKLPHETLTTIFNLQQRLVELIDEAKASEYYRNQKNLESAMNDKRKIPDAETRARNVARMRDACKKLDALTLALDELIAMVEEHNRNSPLTAYRTGKYKMPATEEVE